MMQRCPPSFGGLHAWREGRWLSIVCITGRIASHGLPTQEGWDRNPFSEAQFRTFKYRPEFPDRFGSLEHARGVSRDLFAWYNDAHHHSGLTYLTPADVHYGRADQVLAVRYRARLAAYAAHPERFVQGRPRRETLPSWPAF